MGLNAARRPRGCGAAAFVLLLLLGGGCSVWALANDEGNLWLDACMPAVDGRLPAGEVPDYEASSLEVTELPDGTRKATGTVESGGREWFFECQTDPDLQVTQVVVMPR